MTIQQDFSIPSGDDVVLNFTVSDDQMSSLSGATVRWRAYHQKFTVPYGEPVISKQTGGNGITITNAANRLFDVSISESDTQNLTGRYYHEAEVEDASGNKSTVTIGIMTITLTKI